MNIKAVLDLETYPLDQYGSNAYWASVEAARVGLRADGCAVIRNLVRPDALTLMTGEVATMKPTTHYSETEINAYFGTESDPNLPAEHPGNIFLERSSGFVPGDSFSEDSIIDQLYRWPPLIQFIADCLEIEEIFCYADPLACLTINVLNPGQQFSWHYDNNDFAVTVLVDKADDGGLFRYAPGTRSRSDENAAGAAAVMLGDDGPVTTLDLRPGDLQIFRGRYSLHQVTRVSTDSCPRHAAILAYTQEDGLIGGLTRTQQLFGRVLPIHQEQSDQTVRQDVLLD